MREVGRGWQPSVRSVRRGDSAGCQSQDSGEKMEYTLSLVSCRSTLTGLPLNYWVSAPLLLSPPFFSSPLPSCSLQYVCVCSARSVQRRKIERRVGAGWPSTYNRLPGDSMQHKEFPEAFIPRFMVWIYLLTYTEDLFAITQHNDRLYVLLIALWILSNPFRYRGYIQRRLSFPLSESRISNDLKLHVLCIHLN